MHARLFECFHNPPGSNMNNRASNVRKQCDLMHAVDLGLPSPPKDFAESAQNLTPKKSRSGCKVQKVKVTHPCGDQAPSCFTGF